MIDWVFIPSTSMMTTYLGECRQLAIRALWLKRPRTAIGVESANGKQRPFLKLRHYRIPSSGRTAPASTTCASFASVCLRRLPSSSAAADGSGGGSAEPHAEAAGGPWPRLRQRQRTAGLRGIRRRRPSCACTAELAVLRLHGHNAETWEKPHITAAERFRYLYTEDELRSWVGPVRALAEHAEQVHVLMNNCYRDYAVRNARPARGAAGATGTRESPLVTPPVSR